MRRMMLFSLLTHLMVLGGMVLYTGSRGHKSLARRVYMVHVIHVPITNQQVHRGTPEPPPAPIAEKEKRPTLVKSRPAPPKKKAPKKKVASPVSTQGAKDAEPSGLRLDVASFPFPEYLHALKDRIEKNWRIPYTGISSGSEQTTVFFQILRSGQISKVFVETRSGAMAFDQAALNAVIRSAPFLPLPERFQGDDLGVHFVFEYEE